MGGLKSNFLWHQIKETAISSRTEAIAVSKQAVNAMQNHQMMKNIHFRSKNTAFLTENIKKKCTFALKERKK